MNPSRRLVGMAVLVAALAFPLGVVASHGFTDVPDSNTFHSDIDAIADVGVTTGCSPTTYCPKEYVTREQMAAFLNRLGALAPGKTPVVNADKVDGLTSSQFARSDVTVTGHVSCGGSEMIAADDTYTYNIQDGLLLLYSAGQSTFFCPVSFPDGARVTAVRVRVRDATIAGDVVCHLMRYGTLDAAGAVALATTSSSGTVPAPGQLVIEDATIDSPTIDNELYEYVGRCRLNGGSGNTGVYAFSVEYKTEGLQVH